jgi:peptidoglycan hydrolase CwlO-like protein
MIPEALSQIIIGIITGGVGVAIINWLANRGKNKAQQNIDMQSYWHAEFQRLEKRIDDQDKEHKEEIQELRTDIQGRDVTIKELSKENQELKRQLKESREKIERLTARIRELERLMRNYGIDPNCGEKVNDE